MDQDDQRYIVATKKWVKDFVLRLNLCPFAHKVFEEDKIRYQLCNSSAVEELLEFFWQEIEFLTENERFQNTSLIVLPQLTEFENYLSVYYAMETLLEQTEMHEYFQLASFHPNYVFDGSSPNDPSNFTNRSPYPIIHILSVNEVAKGIKTYDKVEEIPFKNIALMKEKGIETLKGMLDRIKNQDE